MKKIKFLMILGVSIILIFLGSKTYAKTNEISILEYGKEEYVMYIKELLDKDFKYAFSNNSNTNEEELNYITAKKDQEGNRLIYLDKINYEKYGKKDVYIVIKEGSDTSTQKIDFSNVISKEKIEEIENMTKIIDVKTDEIVIKNTIENQISKNEELGTIKFNNKNNTYYYQLLKIEGNENYKKLFELVETINNEYSKINVIDKLNMLQELNNAYTNIIENANWEKVNNYQIVEPKSTLDGQKYIAIIKEVGKNTKYDIQLLNSTRKYEEKYIEQSEEENKVENSKNQTSPQTLPITYDSKILIVGLVVTLIAIVFTFTKYKKSQKENENEK